jgi:predicted DNA-binding transcriptional regulator AlpA
MNLPDLLTTKDISSLLNVNHRHCVERIIKRPDFPKPTVNLSRRLKRWNRMDILKWAGIK